MLEESASSLKSDEPILEMIWILEGLGPTLLAGLYVFSTLVSELPLSFLLFDAFSGPMAYLVPLWVLF